jgi:hypothetical protein
MKHRHIALSLITIALLVMAYSLGVEIGHESFGFIALAIILTSFTLLNAVNASVGKRVDNMITTTVQTTIGEK